MRFGDVILSLTGWNRLIEAVDSKEGDDNMLLERILEFLKDYRFKIVSINPFTFELEDLNPQDNVNVTGKFVIDASTKTISFDFHSDIKW